MRLRLVLSGLVAVAVLLVGGANAAVGKAACVDDPASSEPVTATRVAMTGFCFEPGVVSVTPGQTVEFVNDDAMEHNISGPGWFQGALPPGQAVSRTFDAVGVYTFACTLYPGMTGAVVVADIEPTVATSPADEDGGAPATLVLGIGLALLTGLGAGPLFGLITRHRARPTA
jgi:plastocyanin